MASQRCEHFDRIHAKEPRTPTGCEEWGWCYVDLAGIEPIPAFGIATVAHPVGRGSR